MKRFWTALAVALISILAIAGCNDYGNTFQNNTGAQVTFLSPSTISAGSPDFTLTINGSGFVAQTYVTWNGKKLNTLVTLASTKTIVLSVTATVPAALVAKPGTATVITQNPFSGAGNNGLSNPIAFIINAPPNPVPTLTLIAPATIAACGTSCTNLTLDLQGTNFITSSDPTQVSQVRWTAGATQTTLVTTSVTATDIKATVPGSLISAAGTAMVTVFNPPAPQVTPPGGTPNPSSGGGGTSTAQTFTITAASGALAHAASASQTLVEETPSVSADGRYVDYSATENEHTQVFVRDTCEGAANGCKAQTTLLSAASDGSAANDDSGSPSISANGRYVAVSSAATNLVENAPAGHQVYLRDTCSGTEGSCSPSTQIVSIDPNGALTGTESLLPSISASGRFVTFLTVTQSHAQQPGVAAGAKNSGYRQVFVRDTCVGVSSCTPS